MDIKQSYQNYSDLHIGFGVIQGFFSDLRLAVKKILEYQEFGIRSH